jgi:hypothetical protein
MVQELPGGLNRPPSEYIYDCNARGPVAARRDEGAATPSGIALEVALWGTKNSLCVVYILLSPRISVKITKIALAIETSSQTPYKLALPRSPYVIPLQRMGSWKRHY